MLAQTLAQRAGGGDAALAAAVAEACGPRLAREVSFRGVLRDGRLLLVVRSAPWAGQVEALGAEICARVSARLGQPAAAGVEVRVAGPER